MLTALHFFTHAGIAVILANLARCSRRDRWLVVLAALVPDLDGAGILWSQAAYEATHRMVGHSLPVGLLLAVGAARLADRRWTTGLLAAASFLLHLLLDTVGTGGLPIHFLWPFTPWTWSYRDHWTLRSWQNGVVMGLTLVGVVATARWRRRRPRDGPTAASARGSALPARSTPPS